MGNAGIKGLAIDKNAVEANDYWALYNADMPNSSNDDGRKLLSIFQGEPVVSGQMWVQQGPMERAIRNLMIYRHPYILRYVATWDQGGQKHLATERVRPLVAIMSTLSDIQVCLGLRTILCSLIFLVEKAMARHLNICTSSIYITDNGSWRLAGFEYVWKNKEVTKNLLDLANSYRYKTAIDPCETKENNSDSIEQFAFATLCEEILIKCTKSDTATPHIQDFRDYCATHLKHQNAQMRPKLSAVLLHPYFNHEFVLIHSFLFELPLKNVAEKQDFFTGLIDRLRYFNEEIVGIHLASDLLSRMVLLDPTAQLCVTPYVLKTKTDHSAALFSNQTYLRYLMPHIKRMFRLRDAQMRLILLEYFMEYVRLLTEQEIEEFILPHLLAGMSDTNDILVAKTLRCLADLVPILGSATVLGGNRSRLFSDGRPQAAVNECSSHWVEPRSITPVMGNSGDMADDYMVSGSPLPGNNDINGSLNSLTEEFNSDLTEMPPRLSPDGGEDEKSAILPDGDVSSASPVLITDNIIEPINGTHSPDILSSKRSSSAKADLSSSHTLSNNNDNNSIYDNDVEEDAWSDWENDELQRLNEDQSNETHSLQFAMQSALEDTKVPYATENSFAQNALETKSLTDSNSKNNLSKIVKINDDLSALDIQVQKITTPLREESVDFDFFKDMEPVIETKKSSLLNTSTAAAPLNLNNVASNIFGSSSRLAATAHDDEINMGWQMDDEDAFNIEDDLMVQTPSTA